MNQCRLWCFSRSRSRSSVCWMLYVSALFYVQCTQWRGEIGSRNRTKCHGNNHRAVFTKTRASLPVIVRCHSAGEETTMTYAAHDVIIATFPDPPEKSACSTTSIRSVFQGCCPSCRYAVACHLIN